MKKSGRVALAEMVSRGNEKLVLIRPSKGGLVLQTMFTPTRSATLTRSRKARASVSRRQSSSWQIT